MNNLVTQKEKMNKQSPCKLIGSSAQRLRDVSNTQISHLDHLTCSGTEQVLPVKKLTAVQSYEVC